MNESVDRNDLAFWFPQLLADGLPVPKTAVVSYEKFGEAGDLFSLLDGKEPAGWDAFVAELVANADGVAPDGGPFFLRTGHTSGKHSWGETCFVESHFPDDVGRHVAALVEESALADMMGLPTDTWAVRELIDTAPLFRCRAWEGFPVVREFRVFVRLEHDQCEVEAIYPYWPSAAVAEGDPDADLWPSLLGAASVISVGEASKLSALAIRAAEAVGGGFWSVDFMQGRQGGWWLTDMADGDRSYRPE